MRIEFKGSMQDTRAESKASILDGRGIHETLEGMKTVDYWNASE